MDLKKMKKRKLLIGDLLMPSFLSLITFISCIGDPPPEDPVFVITGTVVNLKSTSKSPIQNASVTLSGAESGTTVTGSDGTYRFDDLTPGTYTVTASHSDFETNSVNVTIQMNEVSKGDLSLNPLPPFTFTPSIVDFGSTATQKDVTIKNVVTTTIGYEIQSTANWLSLSKTQGTISSQNTDLIAITVDRSKMEIGNQSTTLVVNTPDRGSLAIQVLASKLDASSGVLEVDKESLDFGTQLQNQSLILTNSGAKTLDWSLSVDVEWLTSNKVSGSIAPSQTEELTIFASRGGLQNDTYSGNLSFSGTGGTATIPVTMTVTDGGENQAVLTLNKSSIDLGTTQTSSQVTISNTGNRTLNWTFISSQTWLSASVTSGSLPASNSQEISLQVNRGGLSVGNHSALATFGGNGGTQTVTVSLTVPNSEVAVLELSSTALDFGLDSENMTLSIENSGNITLNWTLSSDKPWLTVSNTSGNTQPNGTTDVFVYVSRTGQNNGDYSGTLSAGGNGGTKNVTVSMSVLGGANDQDADGITDDVDADDDNDGLMEVWTINDLNNIRNDLTASGTGKQGAPIGGFTGYELMKDLDFSNSADYSDVSLKPEVASGAGWTPIGNSSSAYFATTFDGNGHVIKKLLMDRVADYAGLFGRINNLAKIQNLGLEIKYFSARDYVGAMVGIVYRGTVINCNVTGNLAGNQDIGLLVGYNQGGTIESCSANGGITGSSYTVGGLVGTNYSYYDSDGTSTIMNSYADVVVNGGENSGGLVGYNASGDIVSFSYALGNVTATSRQSGGLIGDNYGIVTSCYARGDVSSSSNEVGGLIGQNQGNVVTSYSTGFIVGSSYLGGLIGYKSSGSVTETNYWDVTTSGMTTTSGNAGTGLTTAELQGPTSDNGIYVTWDAEVWDFGTSTQYPALKNMPGGLGKQGR